MGMLNHVGLSVSNIERSIAFYTELMGLGEPREDVFVISGEWLSQMVSEPDAAAKVAFLPIDGIVFELLQYIQPVGEPENTRPNRDAGAMHIALNVDDLDATYQRLKDKVVFNSPPQTVPNGPWAGSRVAYLRDPDGTPIELVQSI
ncbi:MAG: VOC family protein [Propionicimonas sp.]